MTLDNPAFGKAPTTFVKENKCRHSMVDRLNAAHYEDGTLVIVKNDNSVMVLSPQETDSLIDFIRRG